MLCQWIPVPYGNIHWEEGKYTRPQSLLGFCVVSEMIGIRAHSDVKDHEFYSDNFFTIHTLVMTALSDGKMKATGTVWKNKTGNGTKQMATYKAFMKRDCGSIDYTCDEKSAL